MTNRVYSADEVARVTRLVGTLIQNADALNYNDTLGMLPEKHRKKGTRQRCEELRGDILDYIREGLAEYDELPGELRTAIEQRVDIGTIRSLVGKTLKLELVGDSLDESIVRENYDKPNLRLVG